MLSQFHWIGAILNQPMAFLHLTVSRANIEQMTAHCCVIHPKLLSVLLDTLALVDSDSQERNDILQGHGVV